MKKYLRYLTIFFLGIVIAASYSIAFAQVLSVLRGDQGGTGIGLPNVTVADIGKVLTVSTVSPHLTYSLTTPSSGGSSGNAFPISTSNYNATSSVVGFYAGMFSNSSTTFNGAIHIPGLSAGQINVDTLGNVYSGASTTFSAGLAYSNGNVTCTGCSGTPVPDLIYLTFGPTAYYTASSTATDNKSWLFKNGFLSLASSTIINLHLATLAAGGLGIDQNGLVYSGATTTAGTGLTYTNGVFSVNQPFTNFANYNATNTIIGFSNGLFSTASSTFNASVFFSNLTQGLAFIGSNGFHSTVATSTLTPSSPLTGSFVQIGSGGSLGCTNAANGVGGCLTAADYGKFNSATTTFTSPLVYTLGTNAVTCPTCTVGGLTLYDSFTHPFFSASASTSIFAFGTSTLPVSGQLAQVTIASSTNPQLSLSSGGGVGQWVFANLGGNFYLATTSVAGTATSTQNAFSITNTGQLSIGTTTAGCLNVNNVGLVSSLTCAVAGATNPAGTGSEIQYRLNATTFGAIPSTATTLVGSSAFVGFGTTTPKYLLQLSTSTESQLALTTGLNDAQFLFRVAGNSLTIATSTPTAFATTSVSNIFNLNQNGALCIGLGCTPMTTSGLYIRDQEGTGPTLYMGGNVGGDTDYMFKRFPNNDGLSNDRLSLGIGDIGNNPTEIFTVNSNYTAGFGTTTPSFATLNISSSSVPQISLQAGTGIAQWAFRNAGGNLYIATTSISGLSTTTQAALTISSTGQFSLGTTTAGCLNSTTTGLISVLTCASGAGTSAFEVATTSNIALSQVAYIAQVAGRTTLASAATNTPTVSGFLTLTGTGATIGALQINGLYDAFTHPSSVPTSFSTTSMFQLGTSTLTYLGTEFIGSSTAQQLSLGDNTAGDALQSFRNAGGNLYLSTSTVSGLATSTVPELTIIGATGNTGIGTSTPFGSLSINAPAQTQPYMAIGSSTGNGTVFLLSPALQVGGNWSFGSTTQDARFSIHANAFDTFNANIFDVSSSSISATTSLFRITNTGSIFAPNTFTQAGAATDYWCYDAAGQFIRVSALCTTSARRFKKDIVPIQLGLNDLLQMQPVEYKRKEPLDTMDSHLQIGFIADDVAQINPLINETLVTYVGGGTSGVVQGFRYDQFTALLAQSIKDLNAKVENSKRSVEENWQWDAIVTQFVLFAVYIIYNEKKTWKKK